MRENNGFSAASFFTLMLTIFLFIIVISMVLIQYNNPVVKTETKWVRHSTVELKSLPGTNDIYLRITSNNNLLKDKNSKCYYYNKGTKEGGSCVEYVTDDVSIFTTNRKPTYEVWYKEEILTTKNKGDGRTNKDTSIEELQKRFYIPESGIQQ